MKRYQVITFIAMITVFPVISRSQTLITWDVSNVELDAAPFGSAPYTFNGTPVDSNIASGALTLGPELNPSTSNNQYGFKVSTAQSSLALAIASDDYIQFTINAASGYTFSLTSLTMNGESSGTGADNVAVLSSVDGFTDSNVLAQVSGIQGVTGGFDTDPSGFGNSITLTGLQYQGLSSISFRIYGWNTGGGAGVTYLRNLTGVDLAVLGTTAISAVPEPSTYAALLGLGALGFAASRRRGRNAVALHA